jgi:peptidyl-prolyl cis-trans isomerase SurA
MTESRERRGPQPVLGSNSMRRICAFCVLAAVTSFVHAQGTARASPVSATSSSQQRTNSYTDLDRIAAIVNDDIITVHELDNRVASVVRQLQKQGTPMPSREEMSKQLLERMIIEKVQMQFAKESGTRVDDLQLDKSIARIADTNGMSLQSFRDTLEKEGVTFASFREDIRAEMVTQRLREREVENKIAVSEAEVDQYLADQARAPAKTEYNLSHILVRVPEQATADQIDTARRRAEQALGQLSSGVDFRQVAVALSDAPDALQGGNIGWRPEDRLPPVFVEAASKLKVGEVSPLLRSANGFHLIKLVDKRGSSGAPKVQQTHVRHILIRITDLVPEAEAKRKILDLKERLENKSADFAELARLYSNDGSASNGGDLGWVYSGDMVPEFERAMNALKPKELSGVVQTPFGLHLIEVMERREEDVSQDRQRQTARQALRARKSDEAYQEWLRQQRDQAYVEYKIEEH